MRNILLPTCVAATLLAAGCTTSPLPQYATIGEAPEFSGSLLRAGDDARAVGDLASAVTYYRRAHVIEPKDAEPLLKLGATLLEADAPNEAIETFHKALTLAPSADGYRGLGNSLIALNQPHLAIDHYRKSLAIAPDPQTHNGMGMALDLVGAHAAAQSAYRQGLALDRGNIGLRNNLGLSLMLSGDYDTAVAMLAEVVQQPGATARQRQNLAMAYALSGDTESARRTAAIDLAPDAVERNLDYYRTLRALNDSNATAQALGIVASNKGAKAH